MNEQETCMGPDWAAMNPGAGTVRRARGGKRPVPAGGRQRSRYAGGRPFHRGFATDRRPGGRERPVRTAGA